MSLFELITTESLPVSQAKTHVLSTANRPAQLGIWIHQSRPWHNIPIIHVGAVEDYSTSWWLWWRAIQPAWRGAALSRDLRLTGEFNWNETRKGSSNGFFLVILSLGLWLSGDKKGKGKGKWGCSDAMKDVEWVLDQMVVSCKDTALALGNKRRSDTHSEAPQSKRGKKGK